MGRKKRNELDDLIDNLVKKTGNTTEKEKDSGVAKKVLKAWKDLEGAFYNDLKEDLKDEELLVEHGSTSAKLEDAFVPEYSYTKLPDICEKISLGDSVGLLGSPVDHPAHYNNGSIECIDGIKAALTAEEYIGFLKGNVLKYLWRCGSKGKLTEDLKKGRWYLERMIAEQEKIGGL